MIDGRSLMIGFGLGLSTAVAIVTAVANAQVPPMPSSQPAAYNLVVSPAELEVISKGLGTQPFNDVLPLMNKLRQQVMEQQSKSMNVAPKSELPIDKPSETK